MANIKKTANKVKIVGKKEPPTYAKRKAVPEREVDPDEPETEEETRRREWIYNNTMVTAAHTKIMVSKQRMPTTVDIARQTGLSPRTVDRHLEEFDYMKVLDTFKAGLEPVMMNLFKQAATGKSEKIMRLYLESIGLVKKKVDITSNGKTISTPPPSAGVITVDPSTLPTEYLEKIIAEHEANNS